MIKTFAAFAKRFAGNPRGGTLMIFAIALPVLVLLTIGTVDLYRIAVVKQQVQDSLDAATLIAARSSAKTDADIDKVGDEAFAAMMVKFNVDSALSTFTMGKDNAVTGVATAKLKALLLGMVSGGMLETSVETVVKRGSSAPLELALVLDTTGSMSGKPIADLKVAAKDLIKKLHEDVPAGAVKIAVVPFGQYVNVGVSRRNQPWMSVPADYTQTVTAGCYTRYDNTVCERQDYACTRTNDGKTYDSTCTRWVNCVTTKLPVAQEICPTPYNQEHKFWGCAGSPAYPKNVEDKDVSRVYPGFLDLKCGSEFTPLTASKATADKAIDVLTASGYTYIPSGLAWGFNMLSQATPMTEAAAYDRAGPNKQPRKALVLMTDGANTVLMDAKTGRHDQSPPGFSPAKQANDYTDELCANIKAEKIEVYTVAFQVDDNSIKKILQGCATDKDHYFDASDAAKLQAAFAEIALSLKSIYIAK